MWPWEESFKSSRVVLDWQSPTNHAREPWRQGPSDPHKTDTLGVQHQGAACVSRGPRAHLTPIRQIRLESSTRMLPGLEFHLVAVIFVTVTAVIIATHHLQSADARLSILFFSVLLICIFVRMVRHRATLHQDS